jgi:hypothetical protein
MAPNTLKVAILGLGAAGAFAARAATDFGCSQIDVYAYGETRFPPGMNWFDWIPEDLQEKFPATAIYMLAQGTEPVYRKRMWGSLAEHLEYKDFPTEGEYIYRWQPEKVFDALIPISVNVDWLAGNLSDVDASAIADTYDIAFQTFPTKESIGGAYAYYPRHFVASRKLTVEEDPGTNYVIFNGNPGKSLLVREMNLFGYKHLEFPQGRGQAEISLEVDISQYQVLHIPEIHPQMKACSSKSIFDPKIHLIGKWALWDIHYKHHQTYADVTKILQAL